MRAARALAREFARAQVREALSKVAMYQAVSNDLDAAEMLPLAADLAKVGRVRRDRGRRLLRQQLPRDVEKIRRLEIALLSRDVALDRVGMRIVLDAAQQLEHRRVVRQPFFVGSWSNQHARSRRRV